MLAGRFATRGPSASPALPWTGPEVASRELGRLGLLWDDAVEVVERDGLLIVLDGYLLATSAMRLPELAERWRSGTPDRLLAGLRGSFTLIVWDRRAERGALVCDHLSLRPCFLHEDGSLLRFATDLPALRRLLPTTPGPDPAVIVPWLVPEYSRGRRTALEGVERLGGAHLLELDAGSALRRRRRYWRPAWGGTVSGSPEELTGRVQAALERAVGCRLDPDDRPTGIALSGGVDSSVVLATAAALRPAAALRSYSAVFPGWRSADESGRIAATRAALGVPARVVAPRPQGGVRLALEYLRDTGGLLVGPGLVVEWPGLRQAARDGVGVMLDGQGGDEVFGFAPHLLADRLRQVDLRGFVGLLRRVAGVRNRPDRARLRRMVVDFGLRPVLPSWLRGLELHRQPVPPWVRPEAARVLAEVRDPLPWLDDQDVPRWWAFLSHLVTESREWSGLAEYAWFRGARHGLRSPLPLLDVDLAETMLRIPPEIAWQRRSRPLPRAAVAGRLPDEVRLARRKANLGPFYRSLLTGADASVVRSLLLDPGARIREWVPGPVLEREAGRLPTEDEPDWLIWTTVQWRMVVLECWLRWLEDPRWVDEQLADDRLPRPDHVVAT